MRILTGDIGGTNARFALIATGTDAGGRRRPSIVAEATYPSRRFTSLLEAVLRFVADHPSAREVSHACFGLPGPIRGHGCETTNLPWAVDGAELARVLDLPEVPLLNDVEAAAWGLAALDDGGLHTVRSGRPIPGNRALLAPGTGLGEAVLAWDGERYRPFATEGGHCDFGPADDEQAALWRFVAREQGHVSWERLASGGGLVTILRFLLEREGAETPPWLHDEMAHGDAPARISERARKLGDPICVAALDLFFSLLGAEAGNLALKSLAVGGVYLAGGIVPKLLPELERSAFAQAFAGKGRMASLLRAIPIHVVTDPRLAFLGAMARALASPSAVRAGAFPEGGPP